MGTHARREPIPHFSAAAAIWAAYLAVGKLVAEAAPIWARRRLRLPLLPLCTCEHSSPLS